jgi:transposase
MWSQNSAYDLLAQIPEDEKILSVGGDGAYDTRKCHAAIAERGAAAVIPVRRNGQPWTKAGPGVEARNETLRATKRLGRTIWKKWSGYHRRSLVETKMHCFKLLGQRVAARTFDRQKTGDVRPITLTGRSSRHRKARAFRPGAR